MTEGGTDLTQYVINVQLIQINSLPLAAKIT